MLNDPSDLIMLKPATDEAYCNDSLRQRTTLDVVAAAGSVRLS
jgi:hypothetical protein